MKYGYKIAPPDYVGTMAATVATMQWTIGKGFSSFGGGQILAHTSWTISDLFLWTSVLSIVLGLFIVLNYHIVIKNKHEKRELEKKRELLEKVGKKVSEENEEKEDEDEERKMSIFAPTLTKGAIVSTQL